MCIHKDLEMPGIEPGAFHMQSERSTTELHPHLQLWETKTKKIYHNQIGQLVLYKLRSEEIRISFSVSYR